MRDNKGVTLIELVITIALLAVIGGFVTYSVSLLTGQDARECANNLSVSLDRAKNYALNKSGSADAFMVIKREGGSYKAEYYVPTNPIDSPATATYKKVEEEKIGKGSVGITCYLESGTSFAITETQWLVIYYDRITGAFKKMKKISSDDDIADIAAKPNIAVCERIEVKKSRTYEITLVLPTGKHTLERKKAD